MKRVRQRRQQEIILQFFTPWATAWMFLPSDKMPSCKKIKINKPTKNTEAFFHNQYSPNTIDTESVDRTSEKKQTKLIFT